MYLRNIFLNTASYLLSPEGDHNLAEKQRNEIQVESTTNNKDLNDQNDQENQNSNQDSEDENEENSDDEENDEDENDDKEEDENNEDENVEETEEQKAARIAKEKEDRKIARQQKKWDRLAAEATSAKNRVKELEAQLAEKTVEGLTEEEVQRRADQLAAEKLAEQRLANERLEFEKTCDTLEDAAIKVDKDFSKKINIVAEEIGPVPKAVIEILADLDNDNGGEVLSYIANDIDEAEDIYKLKDSPRKLAIKLIRISDKLKEAKSSARKTRHSNLPEPITPINEGSVHDTSNKVTGKEDIETFVRKRNAAEAERRKARGY